MFVLCFQPKHAVKNFTKILLRKEMRKHDLEVSFFSELYCQKNYVSFMDDFEEEKRTERINSYRR